MIQIPEKITQPLCRNTLSSLNKKISGPITRENVLTLNKPGGRERRPAPQYGAPQPRPAAPAYSTPPRQSVPPQHGAPQPRPAAPVYSTPPRQSVPPQHGAPQPRPAAPVYTAAPPRLPDMVTPRLQNPLRKGQKTALDPQNRGLQLLKACFGWNIKDARCDMDASAFLTLNTGKVQGDDWFVFYGQTISPDNSVEFKEDPSRTDREIITVDLRKLNRSVQKIVFVLTLNEAFENNLNFSMIKDAYVRILDGMTNRELVSYRLEEYYDSVTSMTIGELYLHNGQWKFNPVGNGVHQDLAGQCAIYGVEIA